MCIFNSQYLMTAMLTGAVQVTVDMKGEESSITSPARFAIISQISSTNLARFKMAASLSCTRISLVCKRFKILAKRRGLLDYISRVIFRERLFLSFHLIQMYCKGLTCQFFDNSQHDINHVECQCQNHECVWPLGCVALGVCGEGGGETLQSKSKRCN